MIAYEAVRASTGARVFRVVDEDREPLRQRIVYHSPTGFEWGYAGSGPADLALNILADAAGWNGTWHYSEPEPTLGTARMLPRWVWELHQRFKFDVVACADREAFRITQDEVLAWVAAQGAEVEPVA